MIRLSLLLLLFAPPALGTTNWVWEDAFAPAEQRGLTDWIQESRSALEQLLGPLDAEFIVHFHRRHADEPVPWAETDKGSGRRVFFHVDTRHDWHRFRDDWTAAHELTHLLLPYLGERSRWFAEGIATYLQYQIMYAGGILSWEEVIQRLRRAFARHADTGEASSIITLSEQIATDGGDYDRLYWGGASYFLHADRAVFDASGQRLTALLAQYQHCCYQAWGTDAEGMIRLFDRLSATTAFSQTRRQTVARPGFPATASALDWLAAHPPVRR